MSSQAFVDRYVSSGHGLGTLIPAKADDGLGFVPSHPEAEEALSWMGFEARNAILELLDEAIADKKAQVRVVAYDLCEPEIVSRLKKLKNACESSSTTAAITPLDLGRSHKPRRSSKHRRVRAASSGTT